MSYINFADLKSRVPILNVALMLELNWNQGNNQLRSACPACESDNNRALVVTPDKGVFYCHDAKLGGDCIALIAHLQGVGMKEAAIQLDQLFPVELSDQEESRESVSSKDSIPIVTSAWQGLDYLEPKHDLVQELGFDIEISETLGVGYAKKGIMRGLVAIPIRKPDGSLIGYIGVTEAKLPNSWQL